MAWLTARPQHLAWFMHRSVPSFSYDNFFWSVFLPFVMDAGMRTIYISSLEALEFVSSLQSLILCSMLSLSNYEVELQKWNLFLLVFYSESCICKISKVVPYLDSRTCQTSLSMWLSILMFSSSLLHSLIRDMFCDNIVVPSLRLTLLISSAKVWTLYYLLLTLIMLSWMVGARVRGNQDLTRVPPGPWSQKPRWHHPLLCHPQVSH